MNIQVLTGGFPLLSLTQGLDTSRRKCLDIQPDNSHFVGIRLPQCGNSFPTFLPLNHQLPCFQILISRNNSVRINSFRQCWKFKGHLPFSNGKILPSKFCHPKKLFYPCLGFAQARGFAKQVTGSSNSFPLQETQRLRE